MIAYQNIIFKRYFLILNNAGFFFLIDAMLCYLFYILLLHFPTVRCNITEHEQNVLLFLSQKITLKIYNIYLREQFTIFRDRQ